MEALVTIAMIVGGIITLFGLRAFYVFLLKRKFRAMPRSTDLHDYRGRYLGHAPTDESATRCGELEMHITNDVVRFRQATGLGIHRSEISREGLVPMTQAEVDAEYFPGAFASVVTVGFKEKEHGRFKLLFLIHEARNEPSLIIRTGGMGEYLGPTVLYNQARIDDGSFGRVVARMERRFKRRVFPRLETGGKAPERA